MMGLLVMVMSVVDINTLSFIEYIRRGDWKIHSSRMRMNSSAWLGTSTRKIRHRVFIDESREYLHQQQPLLLMLFQYFVTTLMITTNLLVKNINLIQALETFHSVFWRTISCNILIVTRRAFVTCDLYGAQGR